jgi:hypothetical protein
MQTRMDKPTDAVYARMLHVWKVHKYVALAPHLRVTAGALRQNKSEGIVPVDYVRLTMLGTGCREEWLLTGEEPIYRGDLRVADLKAPIHEAVRVMMDVESDKALDLFVRAARLFALGHEEPLNAMRIAVEWAENQRERAGRLRRNDPGPSRP